MNTDLGYDVTGYAIDQVFVFKEGLEGLDSSYEDSLELVNSSFDDNRAEYLSSYLEEKRAELLLFIEILGRLHTFYEQLCDCYYEGQEYLNEYPMGFPEIISNEEITKLECNEEVGNKIKQLIASQKEILCYSKLKYSEYEIVNHTRLMDIKLNSWSKAVDVDVVLWKCSSNLLHHVYLTKDEDSDKIMFGVANSTDYIDLFNQLDPNKTKELKSIVSEYNSTIEIENQSTMLCEYNMSANGSIELVNVVLNIIRDIYESNRNAHDTVLVSKMILLPSIALNDVPIYEPRGFSVKNDFANQIKAYARMSYTNIGTDII